MTHRRAAQGRLRAPRVPTWEELNGPLPEAPDPAAVEAGLERHRARESLDGGPCPVGHTVEKG